METHSSKPYDLGLRTAKFAKDVIALVGSLPKTLANLEIGRQVIRSAGSVGANYIEANESLSKRDFAMRVKICRKEAKESKYWLCLLETKTEDTAKTAQLPGKEADELTKIFSAIAEKSR